MPNHPLAEVFGFPVTNQSKEAARYRKQRLCPFNNKVPNCTKDKAEDPLGVCTVYDGESLAVTCPIRLREDWLIAEDAARFFFPPRTQWTSLVEVRLKDKHGESAGNIDLVLVSYNEKGRIIDFGSCEVQSVYISGNIRAPFESYMENPGRRGNMDWRGQLNYPHPDYLSSSRKRLAPQLLFKGGILRKWGKKQAVVVHEEFFNTLPKLAEVGQKKADLAWLIYSLKFQKETNRFKMTRSRVVYTQFQPAMMTITTADPGPVEAFVAQLQAKLDAKLENPPDAPSLGGTLILE